MAIFYQERPARNVLMAVRIVQALLLAASAVLLITLAVGLVLVVLPTVKHALPLVPAQLVLPSTIPSVASLRPVSLLTATQLRAKRAIQLRSILHVLCATKDISSLQEYARLVLHRVRPAMDSHVKPAKKEITCFLAYVCLVLLVVVPVRLETLVRLAVQVIPIHKSPRTV